MRMHAISMWQPFASLWVRTPRLKWHETRHWKPPAWLLGKRILVHAAKTREGIRDIDDEDDLGMLCRSTFGDDWRTSLPYGGFIGSQRLTEVAPSPPDDETPGPAKSLADFLCGNWDPNRFGWLGEDPESWPMVPAIGRQGFWEVEACPNDHRPCFVGGDEPHHRCGTSACHLSPLERQIASVKRGAASCPRCGLEAKTLLHRFCENRPCPVRIALAQPATTEDTSFRR